MDKVLQEIEFVEAEFDAEWYLLTYPDIAEALAKGALQSPLEHYLSYGKKEGRRPSGQSLDRDWYLNAYPLVAEEIGSTALEAVESFHARIGRYRGYIPQPTAKRPSNATVIPSSFGGLWIDLTNVYDLIEGRYQLGLINEEEAQQLRFFSEHGYVILKSAIPSSILDRAEEALEAAYNGKFEDLKFECSDISRGLISWQQGITDYPAKALDLHWLSSDIRNVAFSRTILRFLHLIFERPVLASQSLGFYRGSGQEMHQDSAYVAYTIPQQFAASWIALENVSANAGELMYFPKSHRQLPKFVYADGYKGIPEAKRMKIDNRILDQQHARHLNEIESEASRRELKREKFLANRGDVLIWHADLAHGGCRTSKEATRKSVVHHYCPKEIMPLFTEYGGRIIKKHDQGAFYTTSYY